MNRSNRSPATAGSPCILIVEDEYLIADDIRILLAASGYQTVGPTADLDAAAWRIDEGGVDFVVLDINLAGRLSFDLAAKLQRSGTPFLFLTGYDPHTVPQQLRNAHCLVKPHDPALVVQTIEREMARSLPLAYR